MRIPADQYTRALRGEKTLHLYPRSPFVPKPFKVGNSYPLRTVQQIDGRNVVTAERFRVRIAALGRIELPDVSLPLVQMAGWDDVDVMRDWWRTWHGPAEEVWLIWFVAIEKPRFPASVHCSRHDDLGYTSVPLPGDDTLEAPPQAWLTRVADTASRRDDQMRRDRVALMLRARHRARRT